MRRPGSTAETSHCDHQQNLHEAYIFRILVSRSAEWVLFSMPHLGSQSDTSDWPTMDVLDTVDLEAWRTLVDQQQGASIQPKRLFGVCLICLGSRAV
jgi:hypothetical protein